MSGWFAIRRGVLDHEIFKPTGSYSKFEAWIWLVENARYTPKIIDIGGKPYEVPRGSMCFSERFLASKWGWGKTAVRLFLKQLEAHGTAKITVAKTGTGSKSKRNQITLCNYEKYQSWETKSEPKDDQKRTKDKQGNKETTIPVGETDVSEPIEVSVLSKAVWDAGKPFLASRGVSNPGGMIGKWLKVSDPVSILSAIEAAQRAGTQDPVPYITEILKGGGNDKPSKSSERLNAFIAGARGPS